MTALLTYIHDLRGLWKGTCFVLSHFSRVHPFVTLQTEACQAPLSMGFSRQEYWSGLPCPPPADPLHPGIEPTSFMSPALAGRFPTISATLEAHKYCLNNNNNMQ